MNIKFKILWFEDEAAWYRMEEKKIKRILEEHCLEPDISRRDGEDFEIGEMEGNDYDLILMDYKLAGCKGDSIVSAIRKNDILTDILFYSSEEEKMLEAIAKNMPPIDGVYLTKRDHAIFTEKAEKLIAKIVRRSEDIVNLRGFVLDNTSDFELRIKEILNICWQKFDEEHRNVLTEMTGELLERKAARAKKQAEEAGKKESMFTCVNNDDHILGMADRLEVVQKVLPILFSAYQMPESVCPAGFKQFYTDRISVYRNRLGHIRFGQKVIRINGRDVEINQELHRLLRKNIAEMNKVIGSMEKYVAENM